LFRLVSTRPWLLGGACLSGALAAACGLGPYVAVYWIAQDVLGPAPRSDRVLQHALLGGAFTLGKFTFGMASHGLAHAGAFGILYDLRIRLARKMGEVPLGFFSRHQAGALHKAMTDDVAGLESFLAHILPDAAAAFSVPLAALALMFAIDWRMALASLLAVPFAVLMQFAMFSTTGRESYDRYHDANEATKRAVLEYLRGIQVVKTFGLEARSFGDLRRSIDQMVAYIEEYARKSAPPFIIAMKLLSGGTSALFLVPVGAWLHHQGSLDTATLLLFLLVGTQVLSPFLRIANVLGNVQMLLRGADHIQVILREPPLLDEGTAAMPAGAGIEFKEVDFRYEDRPVLRKLSFSARQGQTTALVGASGAGKSTVVRLISRFWDVTEGVIEIGGTDVRAVPLDHHLSRLSLVFQDVFLFQGSVRDNLLLARPDATQHELEEACRLARIHEVILALPQGYDTPLGERGARLSGGEKQRLSIARALLKRSPILLLDEATAFADAENEALLHRSLRELARGKTVLIIAHRLSTILDADHIVVLDQGEAVDAGTHDELLGRCPIYRRLWQSYDRAGRWSFLSGEAP
jgi:ATP-binding cassette subfamily B protein